MDHDELVGHMLPPDAPLTEAVRSLERNRAKVVLVTEPGHRLVGTVTDGDIRRALIRGISLERPLRDVMNHHPTVAGANADPDQVLGLMRVNEFRQMPIVDEYGVVVDVRTLHDYEQPQRTMPNTVVLMAGGLGSRLQPLTDTHPKPLLHVGPRPILETVIDGFSSRGFRRFFISVNYRAEMVIDHFGDGSRFGVEIRYIEEEEPLGTAGSLSLLPGVPEEPLLVSNADLLTRVNYLDMLDLHAEHRADVTMAVRAHEVDIPFGVVDLEHEQVVGVTEKPRYTFFVNAGIYVLEPSVLARIPQGRPLHMTELVDRVLSEGGKVAGFPVREFWLDIGRMDDLRRAEAEFGVNFEH